MTAARTEGRAVLKDWLVGHRVEELRRPRLTPQLMAKFAFDEWLLQIETVRSRMRVPTTDFRRRLRDELDRAGEMFEQRGWLSDPRSYHQDPPPLRSSATSWRTVGVGRVAYGHLKWASGFAPHDGEPGGERWSTYERNATAHAWVLRHHGEPRPWVVAANGYRTGQPMTDLMAFRSRHLHHDLGLNVAVLVQPLHGPRAEGRSGDRVLFGGVMNTVHQQAQVAWDLRRLLSWVLDDQEAPAAALMGLSLGGHAVALTAALDDRPAAVVAGIPEADLARGLRRTIEPLLPPFYEQWGLSWGPFQRLYRVVSPMSMPAVVERDGLAIFAGLVDRWVRPGNVHDLWEHWGRPPICWYDGGHLSFVVEPEVDRFVDDHLRRRLGL